MRYLVTGGAGFIGSHLVDALLAQGEQVVVIDDFSEGKYGNLPAGNPLLEVHKESILDDNIGRRFDGVDVVFHLAALPRPQLSILDPMPANRVNVEGTLNVLMKCKSHKVRRLVFASSASVYGEQDSYPSHENSRPNPMSPYAAQKLMGEAYCRLFSDVYNVDTCSLRLFNVYGPRMNPNGEYASLIPKFINLMRNDVQPMIFGDGEQARDFVYVDDVVDAFVRASRVKLSGMVINVGTGVNYSVNRVFEIIRELLGKDIDPIHIHPVIEPTQTLATVRKAFLFLDGWVAKVQLRGGIEKML